MKAIRFAPIVLVWLFVSLAASVLPGCEREPSEPPAPSPSGTTATRDPAAIELGAIFPLTGDGASYGQKAKRGIELAVEEANAAGGLLGRNVTVNFQDDRNDNREAVSIATRLTTIDKVPVIFGSAGSTVSLAIAPIANRHKTVLISPISSSTMLSEKGGPYFFRTCPADDLQAEILATWVHESGAKRVAVVYTNNSWGNPYPPARTQRKTQWKDPLAGSEGRSHHQKAMPARG